jgi:hypothetical protein
MMVSPASRISKHHSPSALPLNLLDRAELATKTRFETYPATNNVTLLS